jgi:hypothetical protein
MNVRSYLYIFFDVIYDLSHIEKSRDDYEQLT